MRKTVVASDQSEDGREACQAFCPALYRLPHHEKALANIREAIDLYVEEILEKLAKRFRFWPEDFCENTICTELTRSE